MRASDKTITLILIKALVTHADMRTRTSVVCSTKIRHQRRLLEAKLRSYENQIEFECRMVGKGGMGMGEEVGGGGG